MAVDIDINKKDIAGIVKDFENLSSEIQSKMIAEIKLSAIEIADLYKIAVPVDTGRLRSSIHVSFKNNINYNYQDNEGQTFEGSLESKPKNEAEVFIGTNVVYAKYVEGIEGRTGFEAFYKALDKVLPEMEARLEKLRV